VRNRAVAVNQIDWLIEVSRSPLFPWLKGALVIGTDVAGEVVEVGAEVGRFRAGDRVLGLARGTDKGHAPAEGAFQLYTLLDERTAAPIPATLDFAQAAVLPLGVSTAASGLFQQDGMRLGIRPRRRPDRRARACWCGAGPAASAPTPSSWRSPPATTSSPPARRATPATWPGSEPGARSTTADPVPLE
jgi:hypothetical protein